MTQIPAARAAARRTRKPSPAEQRIRETLADHPGYELTGEDIAAMSRILTWQLSRRIYDGADGNQFAYVVDFLWMAGRISFTLKLALLDLLDC